MARHLAAGQAQTVLIHQLRLHERLTIGPHVVVTCVRSKSGAIVLGIEAPPEWLITPCEDRSGDPEKSVAATEALEKRL